MDKHGVGVSALVTQETQITTELKASAAGIKLGADVGKKRKINTSAASAEEAPWAAVDLTLPRWALASASGYPNGILAHSIK
jgi:hypothetical protein